MDDHREVKKNYRGPDGTLLNWKKHALTSHRKGYDCSKKYYSKPTQGRSRKFYCWTFVEQNIQAHGWSLWKKERNGSCKKLNIYSFWAYFSIERKNWKQKEITRTTIQKCFPRRWQLCYSQTNFRKRWKSSCICIYFLKERNFE